MQLSHHYSDCPINRRDSKIMFQKLSTNMAFHGFGFVMCYIWAGKRCMRAGKLWDVFAFVVVLKLLFHCSCSMMSCIPNVSIVQKENSRRAPLSWFNDDSMDFLHFEQRVGWRNRLGRLRRTRQIAGLRRLKRARLRRLGRARLGRLRPARLERTGTRRMRRGRLGRMRRGRLRRWDEVAHHHFGTLMSRPLMGVLRSPSLPQRSAQISRRTFVMRWHDRCCFIWIPMALSTVIPLFQCFGMHMDRPNTTRICFPSRVVVSLFLFHDGTHVDGQNTPCIMTTSSRRVPYGSKDDPMDLFALSNVKMMKQKTFLIVQFG